MLPASLIRRNESDKNYLKTRKIILDSKSIKELFDSLTGLKH